MTAYYNEFNKEAAAWLRELIKGGLVAPGVVDERSIADVRPEDLREFTQCHFFAGIGGWSRALRLAGWPDSRPAWTGSCPCQPFSSAGEGKGAEDDRNLWPPFMRLIRERKPEYVFGEQVEAAIADHWLDRVSADMEEEAYALGAAVLGAHSVGADHIRKRLYWAGWLVDGQRARLQGCGGPGVLGLQGQAREVRPAREAGDPSQLADARGWLAELAPGPGAGSRLEEGGRAPGQPPGRRPARRLADSERDGGRADEPGRGQEGRAADGRSGEAHGVADPEHERHRKERDGEAGRREPQRGLGLDDAASARLAPEGSRAELREQRSGQLLPGEGRANFWSDSYWHLCRDGKHRRVPTKPSLFPLADGVPGRVGLLRGAGNAIVPQVAQAFVKAVMEATCNNKKVL